MGIVGLLGILLAFIGLIVLFVLVTSAERRYVPPVVQYGALAGLVIAAIFTLIGTISTLVGNQVSVELAIVPSVPSLDVPDMEVVEPPATIVSADALTATYTVTGVSMKVRGAHALTIAINGAIVMYFSWIVYTASKGLRLGAPFTGLSTHLIRAGSFLFAGSVLSQASTIIGNTIASEEVLMIGDYNYEGDDPEITSLMEAGHQPFPDWPFPSEVLGEFSVAPIAVAAALALLGLVFATGERLQHDSEGLV